MKKLLLIFFRCLNSSSKYKMKIIFNFLESLFLNILLMIEPLFITNVISSIINVDIERFTSRLFFLIILKIVYYILNLHYIQNGIVIKKNFNVSTKAIFIEEIIKCSPQYINNLNSGKIINIFNEDSMMICNYIYKFWGYFIDMLCVVVCLIIMFRLNVVLTIIIVFTYLLNYICNKYFALNLNKKYKKIYSLTDSYMEFIKNEFTIIQDSIVNNYKYALPKMFNDKIEPIKEESIVAEKCNVNYNLFSSIISFISNLVVIIGGGLLVISKRMNLDMFLNFNTYSYKVAASLHNLSTMMVSLQQDFIGIERYLNILDEFKYEDLYNQTLMNNKRCEKKLRIKDLNYKIGNKDVIRYLNTELNIGEMIAIVGANGTGKTTLLKLISGILKTTNGGIHIDDINIKNISCDNLIKNITLVMQEPIMHETSIWNNLVLSDEATIENREFIIELTKYFELYDDIVDLKFGFETVVDEQIKLSTGQRKKIQIIRCLLRNTSIYLFDEPTSNLDNNIVRKFYKLLSCIKQDKLIIVVTHSNELDMFDKIINLDRI